MSLSPMSHVEFKKCPCRPVDFRGQRPLGFSGIRHGGGGGGGTHVSAVQGPNHNRPSGDFREVTLTCRPGPLFVAGHSQIKEAYNTNCGYHMQLARWEMTVDIDSNVFPAYPYS